MAISVHVHSERRRNCGGLNCFSRICHLSFGPEFRVLEFCSMCPFNNKNLSSVLSQQMNGVKGWMFLGPPCWLMTSCSSPPRVAAASKKTRAADQSINQSHFLAVSPGIYWESEILLCILNTFGMMVTVESKCKDLHLDSWLSIFHSVSAFMPEAKDSLCAGASVQHMAQL